MATFQSKIKNASAPSLRLSHGPPAIPLTPREELNNGRMAMIAISGICAAELATGKDSDSLNMFKPQKGFHGSVSV